MLPSYPMTQDITRYFESIQNRITKRHKQLSKWARTNHIQYYRLFDRDITECPFIIDALSTHWLLWMCDSKLTTNEYDELTDMLTAHLTSIDDLPVIIKDRRKGASYDFAYDYEHTFTDIEEGGLQFKLNLTQYLDVGLFVDHRHTREYIRSKARDKRVLNLFAYTGSVSCYAIDGMAKHTTSVDLSKRYCQWHQDNCDLNGFKPDRYSIITQDVMQYLTATKQQFDIIFCDPPSFSVTKDRRIKPFQVQENGAELIQLCLDRLTPTGELIFSTNYKSFKMDAIVDGMGVQVKELTKQMCPKDFVNKWGSRAWKITR